MEAQGYELDITDRRLHHEIYLSDARKNCSGKAEDGDPSSDKGAGMKNFV
jgi:hypothetical protein